MHLHIKLNGKHHQNPERNGVAMRIVEEQLRSNQGVMRSIPNEAAIIICTIFYNDFDVQIIIAALLGMLLIAPK